MADGAEIAGEFKILLVGASGSGKTAILYFYTDEKFLSEIANTVGIDFKVKIVTRDDKNYKLAVWDTAGQEKYLSITTAYFRGADGFLLVFDLSSADTFDKVGQWHATIKDNVPEAPVILVGNKSDLTEERTVAKESAQALADELGVQYFETSAKDNVNINEVFEALLNEMSPPPAEPEPPVEPAAEKPVAEKPAAEKPAAEKPVAEKPAAEKPAAEKPVAEKPAAEKPVAEKPVAKKPAAEKPDHVCLTDEQQPRQDKCAC